MSRHRRARHTSCLFYNASCESSTPNRASRGRSERQVLRRVGRFDGRESHCRGRCHLRIAHPHCRSRSSAELFHSPSADACVPAILIFAAFNVEAQANFIADIDGKLVDAIAEEFKCDFTCEPVAFRLCFQHILFGAPWFAARTSYS